MLRTARGGGCAGFPRARKIPMLRHTKSLAAVLSLLAACGGGSKPGAATPTGNLEVDITGVPGSAGAPVDVTGPKGSVRVASGTVLTGLDTGDYAVTAGELSAGGKTYAATVSGSPAHVQANATAKVAVTYAEAPGAPAPGSLQILVNGLPAGLTGQVSVAGPGGFLRVVSESAVLDGLVPGSYAVSPAEVSAPGDHVRTLYEGRAGSASVDLAPGASATDGVTYAPRPGSGLLWGRAYYAVGGYDDWALGHGGGAPTVAVGNIDVAKVAVDKSGDLFVLPPGAFEIAFFPVGELATGSAAPSWQLAPATGARDLALDDAGGLWVAAASASSLDHYPASQVGASSPTPDVTVTLPLGASALAFDGSGDLWAVLDTSIVELTPAQLKTTGTPAPAVTLTDPAITSGQHSMAFDAGGTLWLANPGTPSIIGIPPASLAASANGIGYHQLSWASGAVGFPYALAFDESGYLWVSDVGGPNRLAAFSPGQLWGGFLSQPALVIDSSTQPGGLAFDPPPQGLPLAR